MQAAKFEGSNMPLILSSKTEKQNLKVAQFSDTSSAQVSFVLGEQSISPHQAVCSLRGSQELCLKPPDVDNPTTHLNRRWHWPQEAQVRNPPELHIWMQSGFRNAKSTRFQQELHTSFHIIPKVYLWIYLQISAELFSAT